MMVVPFTTLKFCNYSTDFKNAKTFGVDTAEPDHDQQHCYHHAPTVKPEAATAVVELLMMGREDARKICSAVNKRQVINWRNCCT
jgi:hypothetical protein